jgi:O-antigen/teichoic acid export membrane protein
MVNFPCIRGKHLATPFRNIARLSVGDAAAKTLTFLAFVYLARVLGVERFGILEFAGSLLVYFLLLGDGGLELWATREVAKTPDLSALVARILPLRVLLATASFGLLIALLPLLPGYPELRQSLGIFGLTLFAQAISLKWVFMGQEKMSRVAWGLVLGQIVFLLLILGLVHNSTALIFVALIRLASDICLALYFGGVYLKRHGWPAHATLRGAGTILGPALTIGAAQAMGLLNYNFDSVLLGFLADARTVGLYNAAYKPVMIALALPLTYFAGLFPALSRTHAEGEAAFRPLVERSLRLSALMVAPLAVGGTLLAKPIIELLFGVNFVDSAQVLPVLIWSAVLVILRGSYRQSLTATGHQAIDLRSAIVSSTANVGLNLLLIPRYGMMGAATATVIGDALWFLMSFLAFESRVMRLNPLPYLARPVLAGGAMAACLVLLPTIFWIERAILSLIAYFVLLLLLREPEVCGWSIWRRPETAQNKS